MFKLSKYFSSSSGGLGLFDHLESIFLTATSNFVPSICNVPSFISPNDPVDIFLLTVIFIELLSQFTMCTFPVDVPCKNNSFTIF